MTPGKKNSGGRENGKLVSFHERLKKFRSAARLSQRAAARLIGVPESTYREWEYGNAIQGEPYPSIAKAFNISLNELFGLSDTPEETTEEVDKIISSLQSLKSRIGK